MSPTMDRVFVECSALGFQAVLTILLALAYTWLWRRQRRPYFLTWALAWTVYAARLAFMSAFLVERKIVWLFIHQACTNLVALLLLLAAFQLARGIEWRARFLWLGALAAAWAYVAIYHVGSMEVAGTSSAVLISAVTFWTAWVFWRHQRDTGSDSARILAWTFLLWGLHHLDYPLLRNLGVAVLYGVFADVLFIVVVALGKLSLVAGESRRALTARTAQLEQLTRLLLRAQEDERRRIARELHDEAGQVLSAVKIELDLEGRTGASQMVSRALAQVRDLSNLLRPSVLDDLGLVPALRGLVDDFSKRTRIDVSLQAAEGLHGFTPEQEVVIYRVVQEALTNVARHAGARQVRVGLQAEEAQFRLTVEDDGRGLAGEPLPHLGLLGMRERVTAVGGTLAIAASPARGFRLEALIPTGVTS